MSIGALAYSTIFRSRLGALNLALDCSDRSFAARAKLKRSLENRLKTTKLVTERDPAWNPLVHYLVDKGFVSKAKAGKTKYKLRYEANPAGGIQLFDSKDAAIAEASFAIADVWLSDERVRSTIGAPTVENVEEILDFAIQMEMVSGAKGNWTSAGKLAVELRTVGSGEDNPFVLGADVAVYVRTLFRLDGWMLRAMGKRIAAFGREFSRDEVIGHFGGAVDEVGLIVKSAVRDKEAVKNYAVFSDLVHKNLRKRAEKGPEETLNLGVLEHRVTPRLEWLADLRVLRKELKNSFVYVVSEDCDAFVRAIEGLGESEQSRDDAALNFLIGSSWAERELIRLSEQEPFRAVLKSYALVRPPVGPARIDDVCFMSNIFVRDPRKSMDAFREYIMELARKHDEITISGDRFSRAPRLVHVRERLWRG